MCASALARRESRGAHQRLDAGMNSRNDSDYLQHSLASYQADGSAKIAYQQVNITKSAPAARLYGAAQSKEA
jgi:fumarate reductase flavoprotein subunit